MILYLDSSALVKLYVSEAASEEVRKLVDSAESVGTAAISRVEVSAALAKSVRTGALLKSQARKCLERFRLDWESLPSVGISEALVVQADELSWVYDLRAYDAVQLAAARFWQAWMGSPLTFATFDYGLWKAAYQNFDKLFPTPWKST